VLNLDPSKLLIIAVVAVILLGPDKLPQVARQVGSAWRSFGEFRHRMESEVRSSIPDLPSSADIARLARSPSALLNHLSNMAPNGDEATDPDGGEGAGDQAVGAADGAAEGVADGVPTSADPTGDEQPVPPPPGGSDTPSGLNGSPYTPTDPMPPTPTTRPQSAPPAPGPVPGPVDGDPGLN
jgi:sec-independent protein translocase protein TatB